MEHFPFDRLTRDAKKAFPRARAEALRYGDPYVGTFHLLLGLAVNSSEVRRVLHSLNTELDSLRRAINSMAARTGVANRLMALPFTAAVKEALLRAEEASDIMGERKIGEIQLLLGLLLQRYGAAAIVWERNRELGIEDVIGRVLDSGGVRKEHAAVIEELARVMEGAPRARHGVIKSICGLTGMLSAFVIGGAIYLRELLASQTTLMELTGGCVLVGAVLSSWLIGRNLGGRVERWRESHRIVDGDAKVTKP